MTRRRRVILWSSLSSGLLLLVTIAGAIAVLRSAWFKDQVRQKIVSSIEAATGARIEFGNFSYDWRAMKASVSPLVLHGTEPAGGPPLLRVAKVEVEWTVVSLMERHLDLASLIIEQPEVFVVVTPDGRTNVPWAKIRASLIKDLLDIEIRRTVVTHGNASYNLQRIPLDLKAEGLTARVAYETAGPRYVGDVHADALHFNSGPAFAVDGRFGLSNNRLDILRAKLTAQGSQLEAAGTIDDFESPHGAFDLTATVSPGALKASSVSQRGEISLAGKAKFTTKPEFDWELDGKAGGRGLDYKSRDLSVSNIRFDSKVHVKPQTLEVRELRLLALNGEFRGQLDLSEWSELIVTGNVHGMSLSAFPHIGQFTGAANGTVRLEGHLDHGTVGDALASAKVAIEPGTGGTPLSGFLDASYDQAARVVTLGDSHLSIGGSQLKVAGVFGRMLNISVNSQNLNELLSVLPMIGEPIPRDLPFTLGPRGSLKYEGTVMGPLNDPRFKGQVELIQFKVKDQNFDRLTSSFDLWNAGIDASSFVLTQGPLQAQGAGQLGLTAWRLSDSSPVSGTFSIRGADLKKIVDWSNSKVPLTGTLSASGQVKGTFGSPRGTAELQASNITAYDEHVDRANASASLTDKTIEVSRATLSFAGGQLDGKGTFQREDTNWTRGRIRLEINGRGLALDRIKHADGLRMGVTGQLEVSARGTGRFDKEFRTEAITSQATLRNVVLDKRGYGDVTLSANSRGTVLDIKAHANLLGTPIDGNGEWKLEGDDPGHGEIVIPRMTVATLHQLIPNPERKDLPFEGFLEGKIDLDGPLRKPDQMTALIHVNALQVNASAAAKPRAGAQARDLVLRNSGPIVIAATTKAADIRSARFTGTDTTLEVQGRYTFDSANPWDAKAKGSVNLAILQIFNANLLGSGASLVDVAIRGPMAEPQVEGRLELRNASLYVSDLPNGLDQANGVILFDRNRATVDSLTAATGGGRVTIQKGSFVGFRGQALLYRVQGTADRVRYRSPEGVSITVNALLNLIGTSDNSVLSGTVTVIRAGFNPTTDVGGLLANTARPISTPSAGNEYLKGIQFDVRVESAASLEIQTSLARDIQAAGNLRLRGTPERPVVLGTLSVNRGRIEFFGNQYTINRGEVSFYNPVKVEPIIDMALETVVRGITVDVTFAGPLSKLNFSYRSDPPLQTNDIIALLAVGRTPVTTGALASNQTSNNTNYLSTGSNALLAQAISEPTAGRLQRFFGVSHIKIDPQLTDITSVPQARLTLEQQISKDITLTYITNLTRTQEQIIRVEWNMSRQWSVIALRDENGAFGIDFQYRKRFK